MSAAYRDVRADARRHDARRRRRQLVLAARAAELHRSERIARQPVPIRDALALLEEHPKRMAAALAVAPPARLRAEPMLGTWTATDVLAHLRSCADAFVDIVPRILADDRPRLETVGPRDRIETNGYRDLAFGVSFRVFVGQRPRVLAILRGLPRNGASREAVIVDRGRSRVRTVQDYVDWLVRHEAGHVEQFERFGRKLAR